MKRFFVFAVVTLLISFFLANLIGVYEIPDSYFYLGLGSYLYTGYVPPVGPFNYTVPQTLFGPIYALVVYPLFHTILNPLVLIPLLQLVLVGLSAFMVAKITQKLLPQKYVPIGVLLFLLLPFNIIYAFFMMSEVLTMFLVTLALFILVNYRRRKWHAGVLILICSLLVLTRYAFLPIFAISLIYWISSKPKKVILYLPALIGLGLIAWWVLLHIKLYKQPLISTFTGRHLYNNVITAGKFLPQDKNSNSRVAQFFVYTSSAPKLDVPWWDLQAYFAQAFAEQKMSEIDIDKAFLAVSLQGIKENPLSYSVHLLRMAYKTFQTAPYHANVLTQLGFKEADCSYCSVKMCRFEWFGQKCQPEFGNKLLQQFFAYFLFGNKALYPVVSFLLLILAAIGIISSLLQKNKILIVLAGLFLLQHFFQSASEWVEGRFLIPLYPLYTILILYGVSQVVVLLSLLKRFLRLKFKNS